MTSFADFELDPKLEKWLSQQGFNQPTNIQQHCIEQVALGENLLCASPTGTGKTLAFLLPAFELLIARINSRLKTSGTKVLIIAPTRELVLQIAEVAQSIASSLTPSVNINIAAITGGVSYTNHGEIFNEVQDLVVATPGRLLQYIKEENFSGYEVEMLVFDEADRLLEMGFGNDALAIVDECKNIEQTLLFSATLTGEKIESFSAKVLKNAQRIDATPSRKERKKIQQYYYHADSIEHKQKLLARIINDENIERAIVFVRKKEDVRPLYEFLFKRNIRTNIIEGDMAQSQRSKSLELLKDNKIRVLVATDVAARGLDIDDISHIINYDLPYTADTYVHRIGRCGRAGKKGIAISLVQDHDYIYLGKAFRFTKEPIKLRKIKDLEPKTKMPKDPFAKPSKPKAKNKDKTKKAKDRLRDRKNKGKPKTKEKAKEKTKS